MPTGSYTDPLQSQPRSTTEAAKEQASAVWNDTKNSARSMLGEQQGAVANGLGDLAQALRKAAREMGNGGQQAQISRFAETAADGLERFSGSLRNKDLRGVMRDVESFARQQPVAFFGAAVAAGFLAVRFLKSSSPQDQVRGGALPDRGGASLDRGGAMERNSDMPFPY